MITESLSFSPFTIKLGSFSWTFAVKPVASFRFFLIQLWWFWKITPENCTCFASGSSARVLRRVRCVCRCARVLLSNLTPSLPRPRVTWSANNARRTAWCAAFSIVWRLRRVSEQIVYHSHRLNDNRAFLGFSRLPSRIAPEKERILCPCTPSSRVRMDTANLKHIIWEIHLLYTFTLLYNIKFNLI